MARRSDNGSRSSCHPASVKQAGQRDSCRIATRPRAIMLAIAAAIFGSPFALSGAQGAQDDSIRQARALPKMLAHFVADQRPLARGEGAARRFGSAHDLCLSG
jgi:hypothetical protein